jgi:hypothetical protein
MITAARASRLPFFKTHHDFAFVPCVLLVLCVPYVPCVLCLTSYV